MNADPFDSLMGFLCIFAICSGVWLWARSIEEQRIVETCDNYGSFIYQDVRYTCEKVEGEQK